MKVYKNINIPDPLAKESLVKNDYFFWLRDLVDARSIYYDSYNILLAHLYYEEFTWSVPNDDNRSEDGIFLRQRYAREHDVEYAKLDGPCTVLEMLVALAVRVNEDVLYDPDEPDKTEFWFSTMISNMGLQPFIDEEFGDHWQILDITDKINKVLDRKYEANGEGGMFPLKHPTKDQRHVEIWYQLSAYIIELYSDR